METFIGNTADYLLKHYRQQMHDVWVVFPNRRPAVFLQKELKERCEEGIWMPEILSIDDFVFQNLGWRKAENVEMLLDLYAVHQEVELKEKQGFDRFMGWARILLSDFNELDLYLADHKLVFRYLEDAKNIAKWRADGSTLSELEKSYVDFFSSLKAYYEKFRERMLAKQTAWQGLAYRELADKVESFDFSDKKIVFAGFNAMTPAEEKLIKHLHQKHSAVLLWDADTYYVANPKHEAGSYMRRNLKNFPQAKDWIGNYFQEAKRVETHAMAGQVAQAKLAGQLIKDIRQDKQTDPGSIAIVLPDEELLLPLLSSVPGDEAYNVTMSLPLKNSLSYKLVIDALDYYLDPRSSFAEEQAKVYTKALEKLLLHPFVQLVNRAYPPKDNLLGKLQDSSLIFATEEELKETWDHLKEEDWSGIKALIFARGQDGLAVLGCLKEFLSDLNNEHEKHFSKIEREVNDKLLAIFDLIEEIVQSNAFAFDPVNIKTLFLQLVSMDAIPFKGEPLEGIQIMGMLESRNLDFETLIILSANEGVLPKVSPYQSFLLFELRKELGLPLPREKDEIFAYHFYRLIQRARKVHLLYNTETSGMGEGEASRYIKQLQFELHQHSPNRMEATKVYSPKLKLGDSDSIEISKSPEMLDALLKRFAEGFSASSLAQYAHCQLQFYYSKILGIRTTEQIQEVVPPNVLGTIVHDVLEDLYKPLSNEVLSKEILQQRYKELDKLLDERTQEHYAVAALHMGKNILLEQVVRKLIENVRDQDFRHLEKEEMTFIGAEENYSRHLKIEANGQQYQIPFKGIIDRMDRTQHLRFIDFKTGKVEENMLKVEVQDMQREFDGKEKPAKKMAFQLLMYAWLKQVDEPFRAGIMTLKKGAKLDDLKVDKQEVIAPEILEEYEKVLTSMLSELLDMSEPIRQTPHIKHCEYCDFAHICQRNQT